MSKRGKKSSVLPATAEEFQRLRQLLAESANANKPVSFTRGGGQLPEQLSPYLGLDPEAAKALAEAFPAPNPDLVVARRLRLLSGYKSKYQTVALPLPHDVLFLTGMRQGDLVLISGWHQGIMRIVRVPEGNE